MSTKSYAQKNEKQRNLKLTLDVYGIYKLDFVMLIRSKEVVTIVES